MNFWFLGLSRKLYIIQDKQDIEMQKDYRYKEEEDVINIGK